MSGGSQHHQYSIPLLLVTLLANTREILQIDKLLLQSLPSHIVLATHFYSDFVAFSYIQTISLEAFTKQDRHCSTRTHPFKMSSLEEVLQVQKDTNVLRAPATSASNSKQSLSAQTEATMSFALVNTTGSSNVYAYVSGLSIQNNNAVFMLER